MTGHAMNVATYQDVYKTMEHDHAYPNINLVRLEKWFLKIPGRILDHGCGYGENLIFLVNRGYDVTGVDVSQNLMDYVALKCRIKQVPPTRYRLQTISGEGPLPFIDQDFDHVISLGVLELMGDREMAKFCVNELVRCLKPGGKLIVSTLAPGNSFVEQGQQVEDEIFLFEGTEEDKDTPLKYKLYIPKDDESYASIFPETCVVDEIGSWDNHYCNVHGKHYVALVTKK